MDWWVAYAWKCYVMHFGSKNPGYNYTMWGNALEGKVPIESVVEKDVGVLVANNLKSGQQCAKAAKKARQVLGQMAKTFHYRNKQTWVI